MTTLPPAVTPDTSPAAAKAAAPRRLSWHCWECGANFSTTTRQGQKVTCPKCRTVLAGPARVKEILAENQQLRQELKVIKGHRKREPAEPAGVTKVVIKSDAPPALPAPDPAPEPQAEPEPPAAPDPVIEPKKPWLDRVLGY